jgi:hypothetical protein
LQERKILRHHPKTEFSLSLPVVGVVVVARPRVIYSHICFTEALKFESPFQELVDEVPKRAAREHLDENVSGLLLLLFSFGLKHDGQIPGYNNSNNNGRRWYSSRQQLY